MNIRTLALLIPVFFPLLLSAQLAGVISYKQTIQTNFTPPPDMPKEFADRIPKERKADKLLIFTEGVSSYKNAPVEERAEDTEINSDGGFRMRFRMGGNNKDELYKDLNAELLVDQRNFMDKDFLIEGSFPSYSWKMSGQKKQILDFLCLEAITTIDDTIKVSAWFTPQIPISNGPGLYQGLPGMIMEIDLDHGRDITVAHAYEFKTVEASEIQKPGKGKKITLEEFEKVRKEKMEEMRGQSGGRGVRMIRHGE